MIKGTSIISYTPSAVCKIINEPFIIQQLMVAIYKVTARKMVLYGKRKKNSH